MLKISNIDVSYDLVQVIYDVSMEVKEGFVVALIGSNGAGKTTILKTISGMLKPQKGEIHFNGKRIDTMNACDIPALGIAHVPEGRQIFPLMTTEDNLMLGAFVLQDKEKKAEMLEFVYRLFPRLKERRKQLAGTMSGGESQMLALARGMMMDPKLLILDEPSLGLAPNIVYQIYDVINELKKIGKTILIVEQNVELALYIANWTYVLQTGRLVMQGESLKLKDNDDVRAAYLAIK